MSLKSSYLVPNILLIEKLFFFNVNNGIIEYLDMPNAFQMIKFLLYYSLLSKVIGFFLHLLVK